MGDLDYCTVCTKLAQDCTLQCIREGGIYEDEPVPGAVDGVGCIALCETKLRTGHLRFLLEGYRFPFMVIHYGKLILHYTVNIGVAIVDIVIRLSYLIYGYTTKMHY